MTDERDPKLSQAYRELGREEPPRALDDKRLGGLLGAAAAVVLTGVKLQQHHVFQTSAYDLGMYASTAWNTAHGRPFYDSVMNIVYLSDHFAPFFMLLAPLLCWLMGTAAGVEGLVLTVGVLQAAMAPMVSAAILADEYDLDPALANTVLGAGIVLSLLTVPLGNLLLGGVAS